MPGILRLKKSLKKHSPALVVVLIAFLYRLYHLGGLTLGWDESWHIMLARTRPLGAFFTAVSETAHPILYYGILRLAYSFADSVFLYRMISLFFGTLSIWFLYSILLEFQISKRFRICCLLLFSFSSDFTIIALSIRSYSCALSFTLLGFLFLIRAFKQINKSAHRMFAAICFSLGCLCHLQVCLPLSALFICLIVKQISNFLHKKPSALKFSKFEIGIYLCCLGVLGLQLLNLKFSGNTAESGLSYLAEHLYRGGGWPLNFVLENFLKLITLFIPPLISGSDRNYSFCISLGIFAVLMTLAIREKRSESKLSWLVKYLLVFCIVLSCIQVGFALMSIYPFGGRMRHQIISVTFTLILICVSLGQVFGNLRSKSKLFNASLVAAFLILNYLQILPAGKLSAYDDSFDNVPYFTGLQPDEVCKLDGFYLTSFSAVGFNSLLARASYTIEVDSNTKIQKIILNTPLCPNEIEWFVEDKFDWGFPSDLPNSFSSKKICERSKRDFKYLLPKNSWSPDSPGFIGNLPSGIKRCSS